MYMYIQIFINQNGSPPFMCGSPPFISGRIHPVYTRIRITHCHLLVMVSRNLERTNANDCIKIDLLIYLYFYKLQHLKSPNFGRQWQWYTVFDNSSLRK